MALVIGSLIPERDLVLAYPSGVTYVSVRLDWGCEVGHTGSPGVGGGSEFLVTFTSTARCQLRTNVHSKTHMEHLTLAEKNILIVVSG
jgi:hypothetical protein